MESTEQLVADAQGGDREAFERLVARFQDMAFAAAYAKLTDYHLAQDAAQDAFVEAFVHLHELKAPSAFAVWFRQIVYGKCVRLIRGSKSRSLLPLDDAAEYPAATPGPAQAAEEQETRERVRAALLTLPDHERIATTLFYVGEHSYQEIAAFLDVPLSTVRKRLYSARRRLKVSLESLVRGDLRERMPSRSAAFAERVQERRQARVVAKAAQSPTLHEGERTMNVELCEHSPDDKHVVKNLYTFYRYDLMPFLESGPGSMVNRYGVLNGEYSRTHEEGVQGEDIWWEKPGVLWAFLVRADGVPAGFVMVASPPHATPGVDYRMNEFYILNKFRRHGVGTQAALQTLDRLRGKWEIGWLTTNPEAEAFWRKVVDAHTDGDFEEGLIGMGAGYDSLPGLLFDNSRGQG